jgi:hypothetical protein
VVRPVTLVAAAPWRTDADDCPLDPLPPARPHLASPLPLQVCVNVQELQAPVVPWFPTRISDIDQFSTKTLDAGAELESDHPGFSDTEYRNRRRAIVEAALTYRHGEWPQHADLGEPTSDAGLGTDHDPPSLSFNPSRRSFGVCPL